MIDLNDFSEELIPLICLQIVYSLRCSDYIKEIKKASRTISTDQLNVSQHLHLLPINLVVSEGPLGAEAQRNLISQLASRLDAFSGYLFRT